MKSLKQYILEGKFDWLTTLFDRVSNEQEAIETRFGKIKPIDIKNITELQASKPIEGNFDNKIIKSIQNSQFELIKTMWTKRKEYFTDKNGDEIEPETTIYVYTPETPVSKDEKYIVGLAIKSNKSYIDGYTHIIDFEISDIIKNKKNIIDDLFTEYINSNPKIQNAKGITMKYVHNIKDFIDCKYDGKTFEIENKDKNLIKIEF